MDRRAVEIDIPLVSLYVWIKPLTNCSLILIILLLVMLLLLVIIREV